MRYVRLEEGKSPILVAKVYQYVDSVCGKEELGVRRCVDTCCKGSFSSLLIVFCMIRATCVSIVKVGWELGLLVGCPVGGLVAPAREGRYEGACVFMVGRLVG